MNSELQASQKEAGDSIEKQKLFVAGQRQRFPDIDSYPCLLSDKLRKMRDDLTAQMRADNSGWQRVVKMPEEVPDKTPQPSDPPSYQR